MPTLADLQAKLDSVRREVRNLTVMGMDPSQPPDQVALIKELERSARAEMRLRTKALEYAKDELRSHRQQHADGPVRYLNLSSYRVAEQAGYIMLIVILKTAKH